MHIWIIKFSKEEFDFEFISKAKFFSNNINQLKIQEFQQISYGKFHLLSISTQFSKCRKKYIQQQKNSINGYSGLLIGKNSFSTDLRNVDNINIEKPEKYNGQFALFQLTNDKFTCYVDNLGFHKVFYGQVGNDIYVTNYIEFIKYIKGVTANTEKIVLDFLTNRFGITPGYDTIYNDFSILPEYGQLKIDNGQYKVSAYKDISCLLTPEGDFESKLQKSIGEFKIAAKYLRKYHHTVVPLSGGFDGRTILSYFYNTNGKPLETMTYNRAGKLDYIIAAKLSKAFGVPHYKIKLSKNIDDVPVKIPELNDVLDDPFSIMFFNSIKDFYNQGDCYKVSLGGNGADTDWEFGEKQLTNVDQSNFERFIESYSKAITSHPLLNERYTDKFAEQLENYFISKYNVFSKNVDFKQRLASSFFHLERFRQQGFGASQYNNQFYDIFSPYAIESINQTIFLASKKQLNRGVREGINYRIYDIMTEGKSPYAPILTANNEFGKNLLQKTLNRIFPYLPKIIWKINNGDTNKNLRNQYKARITNLSKKYTLEKENNDIWKYLRQNKIKSILNKQDYNGELNQIAIMLKFIDDQYERSNQ